MVIENRGIKYYVPDEIGNNQELSVKEVFESAIPLEIHNLTEEINDKKNELDSLDIGLDEETMSIVLNKLGELEQYKMLISEIEELQIKLENYGNNK